MSCRIKNYRDNHKREHNISKMEKRKEKGFLISAIIGYNVQPKSPLKAWTTNSTPTWNKKVSTNPKVVGQDWTGLGWCIGFGVAITRKKFLVEIHARAKWMLPCEDKSAAWSSNSQLTQLKLGSCYTHFLAGQQMKCSVLLFCLFHVIN